jgi:hypothetical protein
MYKAHSHRRFSAFLRFSIPEPPEAADRLTALLAAVATGPATLEFAVPSGDKRSLQSLLDIVLVARDEVRVFAGEDWRGCAGGAGDKDLRGDDVGACSGSVICCDGSAMFGVDPKTGIDFVDDSPSFSVDGVSNSGGRVRGVACTLVISLAREQYAS